MSHLRRQLPDCVNVSLIMFENIYSHYCLSVYASCYFPSASANDGLCSVRNAHDLPVNSSCQQIKQSNASCSSTHISKGVFCLMLVVYLLITSGLYYYFNSLSHIFFW